MKMLPAAILFAVAVAYRLVVGFTGNESLLPNIAPVAAIALCGAFLFPRRYALILPLAILLVSDVLLNGHYGYALVTGEMMVRYPVFLLIAFVGLRLARNPKVGSLLLASLGGSTLFYIVSNTVSWMSEAAYAKTIGGWIQALTVGLPGFPPTWVFYRNTLVGDALFTLLFAACVVLAKKREESRELAPDATPLG